MTPTTNKTAGKALLTLLVLNDLCLQGMGWGHSAVQGAGWAKGWSGFYQFSFFVIAVLEDFCQLNKA